MRAKRVIWASQKPRRGGAARLGPGAGKMRTSQDDKFN